VVLVCGCGGVMNAYTYSSPPCLPVCVSVCLPACMIAAFIHSPAYTCIYVCPLRPFIRWHGLFSRHLTFGCRAALCVLQGGGREGRTREGRRVCSVGRRCVHACLLMPFTHPKTAYHHIGMPVPLKCERLSACLLIFVSRCM